MSKIPQIIHCGYSVLETKVLPILEYFQDDIKIHDKQMLTGYMGDFISLYRKSGTHLFKCDDLKSLANWTYKNIPESLKMTLDGNLAMVRVNQNYLYIKADGSFKAITAEKITAIMQKRYKDAMRFYEESFKKMNFEGMSNIIEFFMLQYGKKWKSKLAEEWESQYVSSEARRIRNHFGMDFLKSVKFETKKEEIRKSLITYYMRNK